MVVRQVLAGIGVALTVVAAAAPVRAQLPPGVYAGEKNASLAPAGTYGLDADHTAVLAKVSHIGYSTSVFRFGKVSGTLTWNPANPGASSLKAVVHTVSIETPVAGFAQELAGKGYLNADRFPDATFVSTAFRPTDATHGTVEGQFTLLGKTHPLTFDVTLEGAGKGFMGHPRLGISARGRIDPAAYGLGSMFGPSIGIEVDAEFAKEG